MCKIDFIFLSFFNLCKKVLQLYLLMAICTKVLLLSQKQEEHSFPILLEDIINNRQPVKYFVYTIVLLNHLKIMHIQILPQSYKIIQQLRSRMISHYSFFLHFCFLIQYILLEYSLNTYIQKL